MKDYGSLRRHRFVIPLEIIMAIAAVVTISRGDVKHFLVSIITLSASFLPLLIERRLKVRLPAWVQYAYVLILFSSMFAGEVWGVYAKVWRWDDVAHISSGILMAIGAVLLLAELRRRHELVLPVWLQGTLILSLCLAAAGVWEITEFTSDQLFGTFSQGASLKDTMMDLINDSIGALVVAILWVLYARGKRIPIFEPMVRRFVALQSK